ncbi:hypothetical protein EYF80_023397 [Liparis tanakae]|uniref:Uncharacterized protein n=1 Tax=Liparis tanakae TaxID=230148 RepID=A0A4Z2HKL0_9TELE|nr:hypothetical protein EYF80_023397 [Liparis tanakae]
MNFLCATGVREFLRESTSSMGGGGGGGPHPGGGGGGGGGAGPPNPLLGVSFGDGMGEGTGEGLGDALGEFLRDPPAAALGTSSPPFFSPSACARFCSSRRFCLCRSMLRLSMLVVVILGPANSKWYPSLSKVVFSFRILVISISVFPPQM